MNWPSNVASSAPGSGQLPSYGGQLGALLVQNSFPDNADRDLTIRVSLSLTGASATLRPLLAPRNRFECTLQRERPTQQ